MDTSVLVGPQARDLDIKVWLDFMSRNTPSFQEGACCGRCRRRTAMRWNAQSAYSQNL